MKEMVKKCSTDQRFILKEMTFLKIHTLVVVPIPDRGFFKV